MYVERLVSNNIADIVPGSLGFPHPQAYFSEYILFYVLLLIIASFLCMFQCRLVDVAHYPLLPDLD